MEKQSLPIYSFDAKEFQGFKAKHLDSEVLDVEALESIEELFGLNDDSVQTISCDEMHAHRYSCCVYKSPEAGVVQRLLNEIAMYQRKLKKVHEESRVDF